MLAIVLGGGVDIRPNGIGRSVLVAPGYSVGRYDGTAVGLAVMGARVSPLSKMANAMMSGSVTKVLVSTARWIRRAICSALGSLLFNVPTTFIFTTTLPASASYSMNREVGIFTSPTGTAFNSSERFVSLAEVSVGKGRARGNDCMGTMDGTPDGGSDGTAAGICLPYAAALYAGI